MTTQGSPGSIASYATNSDGIFAVNNAPTGNGPTAIIVLPNLTPSYAFVVNGIDNTISTFSVSDEAGVGFDAGSLSAASTSAPLGSHLVAIDSADPAGVPYLYVVDAGSNNVHAYSVDIATGVLTYIGTYVVGSAPTSIAIPFVNHNTG